MSSEVNVVDPHTVDIVLKDPTQPLMTIIAAPAFGIMEKEQVVASMAAPTRLTPRRRTRRPNG